MFICVLQKSDVSMELEISEIMPLKDRENGKSRQCKHSDCNAGLTYANGEGDRKRIEQEDSLSAAAEKVPPDQQGSHEQRLPIEEFCCEQKWPSSSIS